MKLAIIHWTFSILALVLLTSTARGQAARAPGLIELNDNGAWSWFQDERAIIDTAGGKLIVSSVADASGPGGAQRSGDIDVASYDLATGETELFVLHHGLQDDDHNSAAISIRSDGRYVAMYGGHLTDSLSRWRVSDTAGEIGDWSSEAAFDNGASMTYSNLHYLPADDQGAGRLYNFVRSQNFDPNFLVSGDEGLTWSYGGRLLAEGGSGDRPYLRYASDGQRIHLIATERHPRNYDNSIYHGYVQDGVLYNSAGVVIDGNLLNSSAAAPSALTSIFQTGQSFGGETMQRAWTVDVAIDDGDPVAIFQARAGDDDRDHRFFYGRYQQGQWVVNQMAYGGEHLYSAENDYTGLVSIDPGDPTTVYLSSDQHPATKARLVGADGQQHYELFRGKTADNGSTWEWTPLTFNSTQDNLRPVVPQWTDGNAAVLWMQGEYSTYQDYNTKIVGLLNPEAEIGTDGLKVDFGLDGQVVQPGFEAFSGGSDPSPGELTMAFDSPLSGSVDNQIEVSLSSAQFRDRGDSGQSPLGDIADDFVFANGLLDITFGDLAEGDYQLVLYAHDGAFEQSLYDITLNGRGIGKLPPTGGDEEPLGIASARIAFQSDGASDVTISLASADSGVVILNGFELQSSSSYETPPPYDLNADGELNIEDYLLLSEVLHKTSMADLAVGDLNGDLYVNYLDFRLFQQGYDGWNGAGALAADAASVAPEPFAAWLTALASLGASCVRTPLWRRETEPHESQ